MKIGGDAAVAFLPLFKADANSRTIWARAAVEEPDKAKEIMDYVTAKPQFQAWSKQFSDATLGKSLGNIRAMHNPRHLAGKVQEMVFDDANKAVTVCIKVLDPVDWVKVEEGGYTGLSIGGGYLKKWQDGDLQRYTPRIAEISLVDSPCIPGARFLELQKIDGSIEEVLLKGTPRSFAELLPPPTFAQLHKASLFGRVNDLAGKVADHPAAQTFNTAMKAVKASKDVLSVAGGAAGLASGAYEIRHHKKDRLPRSRHLGKSLFGSAGKLIEHAAEDAHPGAFSSRGKTFSPTPAPLHVDEHVGRDRNKMIAGEAPKGREASYQSRGKTFTHFVDDGIDKQAPGGDLAKGLGSALGRVFDSSAALGGHVGGAVGETAGRVVGGAVGGLKGSGIGSKIATHAGLEGHAAETVRAAGAWRGAKIGAARGAGYGRHAGAAFGSGFGRGTPVTAGLLGAGVAMRLAGPQKKKPANQLAMPAHMTKADPAAQRDKIALVMRQHKEGKLRSWRGVNPRTGKPRRGPKVTDRKQAIAIALNSAWRMDKSADLEKSLLGAVGRGYSRVEARAGSLGAAAGERLARSPLTRSPNGSISAEAHKAGVAASQRMHTKLTGSGKFSADMDPRRLRIHQKAMDDAYHHAAGLAEDARAGRYARQGRTAGKLAFRAGAAGAAAGAVAAAIPRKPKDQMAMPAHMKKAAGIFDALRDSRRKGLPSPPGLFDSPAGRRPKNPKTAIPGPPPLFAAPAYMQKSEPERFLEQLNKLDDRAKRSYESKQEKQGHEETRETAKKTARMGAVIGGGLGAAAGIRHGLVPALVGATLGSSIGHAIQVRHRLKGAQEGASWVHSELTEKQHEQRRQAAKARWLKTGHHDMDTSYDSLKEHAGKAILGRGNKVAAVEQQRKNTWNAVADTHEAYDKVRAHLPKHASLMMEVPHNAGLLFNPEGVGNRHFGHDGNPRKPLYLLHPAEADDFIRKHGKGAAAVSKMSPMGLISHIRELVSAQAAA
jgi:Family of unknown function (DUF6496)